jgi:hypothetical protein
MLETTHVWLGVRLGGAAVLAAAAAGCIAPESVKTSQASSALVAPASPADENARAEEARALVAQAETDIQRARAKRALWLPAWESLVAARSAVLAKDNATAARSARRASEFAQLGLEQLAYPAVK